MTFTRRTALTIAAVVAASVLASSCATSPSPAPRKVLVAGATGQTGQLIVRELLAGGYEVRALVRDTAKARQVLGDRVELVQGDIKDPATLGAAFAGTDAVISAVGARGAKGPDRPEAIDYQGVRNLVDAAVTARSRQFVLVSSRSVTQPDNPLNRLFGNVLIWKLKGEDALRASGVPYTVVRPGGLTNGPGGDKDLVFEQGDTVSAQTTITRADVARICVQALKYPEARNRTFETSARAGAPVTDWRAKFAALKPDP
ncbi:MAG: SDR family oxidoreductase [Gammaproteobacteria bacterium]|nr:SDR family oxidoreductase [Gammaproteobacteria bacterium]